MAVHKNNKLKKKKKKKIIFIRMLLNLQTSEQKASIIIDFAKFHVSKNVCTKVISELEEGVCLVGISYILLSAESFKF